jgi:hypothetical protein
VFLRDSVPLLERFLCSTQQLEANRQGVGAPSASQETEVPDAIKALSPAVNDPTTAVQALDQIEDLLIRLGRRRLEIGAFCDAQGNLRLLMQFY